MRILIQVIIPLLAPIVAYFLWSYWDARRRGKGLPNWEEGKWFWFILLGIFLSTASLIYFSTTGSGTNTKYTSPQLENGKVVPGKHK